MSEDEIKVLYGNKAILYKDGKRKVVKAKNIYGDKPIDHYKVERMSEYKFSLLELKLLRNGILETIAHKNYCGFKEEEVKD